jgi:hypothetical protein
MIFPAKRPMKNSRAGISLRRPATNRPRIEVLECRTLLTTIHWINSSGGSWHVPTNWDLHRVPGAGDDVAIDAPGNYTVTHSTGQSQIKSLTSLQAFTLAGSGLVVQDQIRVDNTFILTGVSSIFGGTVAPTTTMRVEGASSFLSGMTLNGVVEASAIILTLHGPFRNNGVINVNGTFLYFDGNYSTPALGDIHNNGGRISLRGTLENQGSTLTLNSRTGSWILDQATIRGGVVATADGTTLSTSFFSNQLVDVSIQGNLSIPSDSGLFLSGSWQNHGVITLNGGSVTFGGTYRVTDLGEIHRNAGGIILGGTVLNTGTILALDDSTGSYTLAGTLIGGTVTTTGSAILFVGVQDFPGTLNAVTINGDVSTSSGMEIRNGLTLSGTMSLNTGSRPGVSFVGAQTLNGTGTILFSNTSDPSKFKGDSRFPLIVGPGITFRGGHGQLENVVNQGTIQIDQSNSNIVIVGDNWRNEGRIRMSAGTLTLGGNFSSLQQLGDFQRTGGQLVLTGVFHNRGQILALNDSTGSMRLDWGRIEGGNITSANGATIITGFPFSELQDVVFQANITVSNGTQLFLSGTWANQGILTINGGTISISDSYSRAALGDFHHTGGIVQIRGTIDNQGRTFDVDDTTGPIFLNGGTIAGGTVTTSGSARLMVINFGNLLSAVTMNGEIELVTDPVQRGSPTLGITNGLTLNGTLTINTPINFADVTFTGNQRFIGNGMVVFQVSPSATLQATGGTVTLGPGITVRGLMGGHNRLLNFANQGLVEMDSASTLELGGAAWRNEGIIRVSNNTTLSLGGTWVNQGTIQVSSNSTLNLGGNFSTTGMGNLTSAGARVNFAGILDNQGASLVLNNSTGSWNISGGTIVGGTVTTIEGAALLPTIQGGTLNGVWLQTDLSIPNNTVLGFAGAWRNLGSLTLLQGGVLYLGGDFNLPALGNFHRTGGTVRITGILENRGSEFLLDSNSGFWELYGGEINGGIVATTGGASLQATGGLLNAVTINGDVSGFFTVTNGLTVNGNLTVRDVTFNGSQTLDGTGSVILGFAGSAHLSATEGSSLTIGPELTIRGAGHIINLVNQGTILADGGSQFLSLGLEGSWRNEGKIRLIGGFLDLAGTFTTKDLGNIQRDSGIIRVTGTLDNRGNTLSVDSTTGSLGLTGIIRGGTIMATGGVGLVAAGGTLDGVVLEADTTITNNSSLTFTGAWVNKGNITLNIGTLSLGGVFSLDELGAYHRSNGTINLTGTLDNRGRTLALDGNTGSWQVLGGTIDGGIVTTSEGARLIVASSNSGASWLQGVALDGNLDLLDGANLMILDGLALNGNVTVGSSFIGATLTFNGPQPVTGTGVITLGNSSNNLLQGFNGLVTLGPNVMVQAQAGHVSNFVNQGTIVVTDSTSSVALDGNWRNEGLLRQSGGTLNFGGNFTLSALGDFRRTDGNVNLTGTFDNSGQTFTLDANPGPWSFAGGTILGGTLTTTGGAPFTLTGSGTLDGVILACDLNIAGQFTLAGTWANHASLTLSTGRLDLGGVFSVSSLGDFHRAGGSVRLIGTLENIGQTLTLDVNTGSWELFRGTINGGTLATEGNAHFVVPFDARVQLNGVTLNGVVDALYSGLTITNGMTLNGTLSVSGGVVFDGPQTLSGTGTVFVQNSSGFIGNSGSVTIGSGVTIRAVDAGSVTNFINRGTIVVEDRNSTLTLAGSQWRNSGTIQVRDGTLLLSGSFTTDAIGDLRNSGGRIIISGTLGNQGNNLVLSDSTGSWDLNGGAIVGGTLITTGNARLFVTGQGGTLSGVTINTNLNLMSGAPLTLLGSWSNRGTLSLSNGILNLGGTFTAATLGNFNQTGGTVRLTGTLNNYRNSFLIGGNGGTWDLAGGTINEGTVTVTNGSHFLSDVGNSRLLNLTLNGDLDVNDSTIIVMGNLTINGTLRLGRGRSYGALLFFGPTYFSGLATILFQGPDIARNALAITDSDRALTLGPDVTVRGGGGIIGFSPAWSGTSTVNVSVVNEGTVTAEAGQTLTLAGASLINHGVWRARDGGMLVLQRRESTGGIVNAGTVIIADGSILSSNSEYAQFNGLTTFQNGTLIAPSLRLQGGVLNGSGVIVGNVLNDAAIEIGFEGVPGSLNIQGNYTQTADGALTMKIGGTDPRTGYDTLSITGTAALDGTLNVSVLDGFFAHEGDTFTLLAFGQHDGKYATINGLFPQGQKVYFDPLYGNTSFILNAVPY